MRAHLLSLSLAVAFLSRIARGDRDDGSESCAAAPDPAPLVDVEVGGRFLPVRGAVDFADPRVRNSDCYRRNGDGTNVTHHLSIQRKQERAEFVKHVCDIDVSRLQDYLEEIGDEAFLPEGQKTNADMGYKKYKPEKFKPGIRRILLVFSNKDGRHVYRFPWLAKFLPLLQETVFGPLQINPDRVMRMQLALMTEGSAVNSHFDKGEWARRAHRVHVPIITHGGVTFMVESNAGEYAHTSGREFTKIPSLEGVVYEVNNIVHHAVKNTGGNRVHLIVDWLDEDQEIESVTYLEPGMFCTYRGARPIECTMGDGGA